MNCRDLVELIGYQPASPGMANRVMYPILLTSCHFVLNLQSLYEFNEQYFSKNTNMVLLRLFLWWLYYQLWWIHPMHFLYPSGLLHWHWGNRKQSGRSPKVVALFSATNFSSFIIELLQPHDAIQIKWNHLRNHYNIAIISHLMITNV